VHASPWVIYTRNYDLLDRLYYKIYGWNESAVMTYKKIYCTLYMNLQLYFV